MIPLTPGAGLQAAGIGTGLGLGQRKGTEHCATGQRLEELLLLRVIAKLEDRHTTHRVVHAHDGRASAIASGNLFQRHGVGHVAGIAATPLFRHQHAKQTQFGHLLDGLFGKALLTVPLLGKRPQAFLSELTDRVTDLLLFVID
ncbi:hypothetical protein D3C84_727870 [compost metagenome]